MFDDDDVPLWIDLLERFAPYACVLVGLVALAIAAAAWGTDLAAGHL